MWYFGWKLQKIGTLVKVFLNWINVFLALRIKKSVPKALSILVFVKSDFLNLANSLIFLAFAKVLTFSLPFSSLATSLLLGLKMLLESPMLFKAADVVVFNIKVNRARN